MAGRMVYSGKKGVGLTFTHSKTFFYRKYSLIENVIKCM